jgi:23S rRNA (cytosine1962-C5)-methyltransferase
MSKTYLSWAERNMALNGFGDEERYKFIHADALQYTRELAPGQFDLVVLDPPTFSNSKRMEDFLDIQRDHVSMINQCMDAISPGGALYFSTNYRKFVLDRDNINAAGTRDITRATTPFDFQGKLFRWCFYITR